MTEPISPSEEIHNNEPAGTGNEDAKSTTQSTDAEAKRVQDAERDLSRREYRIGWRESQERARYYKQLRVSAIVVAIGLAILLVLFVLAGSNTDYNESRFIQSVIAGGITLLIFGLILGVPFLYLNASNAFSDRRALIAANRLRENEDAIAQAAGSGVIDFASLWVANQDRIEYYHSIATTQSRQSFRNGQIAAFGGFAVIVIVAGLAAFTNSGTGSIAASVIGVAGAGLSAYIGATFMRAQSEAAAQLRGYFLQPVEFSRLLGAERLIQVLPEEQRALAVRDIIRSVINPTGQSEDASDL